MRKLLVPSKFLVILGIITVIGGCSFFKSSDKNKKGPPTLADLQSVPLDREALNPVPKVSLNELEDIYESTLSVVEDETIRHKILLRLADIEMARSEQQQIEGVPKDRYFKEAIAFYQEMLARNEARQGEPETPTNERLLYRLSKAYALDGQLEEADKVLDRLVTDFPESPYRAEADFRQAELAFSQQRYKDSEFLYNKVIEIGDGTPFYTNALYMHAWSRFKQGRYKASIPSYTEVLDRTLLEGIEFNALSNSQRNLANDTLRILSIVFSYLNGPETIHSVYGNLGVRHYHHQLYRNLGDFYLEQNRFRDSADTFRHYVQYFPNTDYSPEFSERAIEVYELGDFPSLVLPAKEEYVRNYGIYSDFWKERDAGIHEKIKPKLNQFIDELASYYHAKAYDLQELNKEYVVYLERKQAGEDTSEDDFLFRTAPEDPNPNFIKAALLYKEFMETFPDDEKTPELVYFMGEAYYEADLLPEAVEAYEIVAYRYLDDKRGAEAGYSAIVSMQRLVKITEGNKQLHWRGHKIESSITYSNFYAGDSRAVGVLTAAAKELFDDNYLERAITQAKRVTEWQPEPPQSLLVTAWLIVSHSQFDLERYAEAESAYRTLLPLLEEENPERPQVIQRIAASMFKRAEQEVAAGDAQLAVDRLLAIRNIAPGSTIAVNAQYDAANLLIDLKDWQRAETELLDFRKQFPQHELIGTLPAKFAFIYQESEQWVKAADVLSEMAVNDPNPEVQRTSLYISAELYEKADVLDRAINQYRSYAHTYKQPFAQATEARFHMVELYEKTNEDAKRNFWLKKLIDEHDAAGSDQTDRSRYLASFAAIKFANDDYYRFKRVKLTLPIKKSLQAKKKAMDKVLESYRKVINYAVAEFATEASHNVGLIYAQLSSDLLDSQRPNGLDALALEQYEILLEEQALPFEEKAIELYAANAERSWKGIYDDWVKKSFDDLAKLLPARYGKKETVVEFSDAIY